MPKGHYVRKTAKAPDLVAAKHAARMDAAGLTIASVMDDDYELTLVVSMVGSLLNEEWRQATIAFAENAGSNNWQRLERIMHARQHWQMLSEEGRRTFAAHARAWGIGHWVPALHEANLKRGTR